MQTIIINGDRYTVTPLGFDEGVASAAWRLKAGSKLYDIFISPDGYVSCDCADATFRQRECKHVRSLQSAGLIPRDPLNTAGHRYATCG